MALKGKPLTEEHKIKIGLAHIGKKHSREHIRKFIESVKGKTAWNKNKKGIYSKETLEKMRQAKLGKIHTQEAKLKMSLSKKGKAKSESHKRNLILHLNKIRENVNYKGSNNPFYGKKHSEESRKKIRENRPDFKGEKHPRWRGGISFEPYDTNFNKKTKEKIYNIFGRKCYHPKTQECKGCLTIHHIDYNKKNSTTNNLIPLCNSHNTKVNNNREYWTPYFKLINKINK